MTDKPVTISHNLQQTIPEPRIEQDVETAAWLAAYDAHDPEKDPEHKRKMMRAMVANHKAAQRAAGRAPVKFYLSQRSIDAVLQRYREKTSNPKASKQDAFEDFIDLALSGQQQLFSSDNAADLRRELSLLQSECADIAAHRDSLLDENRILRESEASARDALQDAHESLKRNAKLIMLLTNFIGGEPSYSQYPIYNAEQAGEMLERCKARFAELKELQHETN